MSIQTREQGICSFSVYNEHNTVQENLNEGKSYEDVYFYAHESLISYLLEFAAQVKQKAVSYKIKKNGIYFRGVTDPVRTMFEHSAYLAGPDSRERAELAGWNRLEEQLCQGAQKILLISPPSVDSKNKFAEGFGDYGFLFYFTRDTFGRLKNTVIKYSEDTNLSTSRLLGYGLNIYNYQNDHAHNYLSQPVDVTHAEAKTLDDILTYAGYSPRDKKAQEIEQLFQNDKQFQTYYVDYMNCIMNKYYDQNTLSHLLDCLYKRAYQLSHETSMYPPPPPPPGSCPVTNGFNYGYYMPRYIDVSRLYETRITTCPTCNKKLLMTTTARNARKMACPCGNSTTCPEAIYDNSRIADNWELNYYGFVETWD